MRALLIAICLMTLPASAQTPQRQSQPIAPTYVAGFSFPAVDGEAPAPLPLGRDLIVAIRRSVDARGISNGWDLSTVDRRLPKSPNFLYECLCGHGPQPFDLYAWHFEAGAIPDRVLPVYGYPYELRVRFVDIKIRGTGPETQFAAGTIAIDWRRLAVSNPPQLRLKDIK